MVVFRKKNIMQFNENLKNSVIAKFNSAIKQINNCKVVYIDIPADFEGAGDIHSALEKIKSANLEFIKSEFERAVNDAENADKKTMENVLGFEFASNGFDFLNNGTKKDNHDIYHQMKDDKKSGLNKNYNYNLSSQLSSGTMYNLNHLTKEQKEKINKGIEEETTRKNAFRLRSSMVNELVSVGKGLYKMGENITDFFALRAETLQEEHLRTIYTSNAQYAKEHGEEYEKKIEKMQAKTLSYVEKDHTETVFNKLYKENAILKEINERAYNPFKTTGVAYKVGEQTAPVISAITVSTVAPHAASVIIPTIIGINSGGRSSEEYLRQKKQTQNNWKTKENLDNAIKYGNAVGLWDAAQYAVGMNLFKFNPTGYEVVDAMARVNIDTYFNATDTPYKAMVYSLLDKETDFSTAFESMGGVDAVMGSVVLGLGGSVFGEVVQYKRINKELNKICELQNVKPNEIDYVIRGNLKNDLIKGNINIEDVKLDKDFLINYTEQKNISNLLPSEIKINCAINRRDEFLKEHGMLEYIEGKNSIDNIVVFKTRKEFESFLINKCNFTKESAKTPRAVNVNDGEIIAFCENVPIKTIIHEENHSLGNCIIDNKNIVPFNYDPFNKTKIQRGIDEAFTESIALRMNGVTGSGDNAYYYNADILNQMIELMNKNGYKDVDLHTYYSTDKCLFANTVNKIMKDDRFYNDLVCNMNIADGRALDYKQSLIYNQDDIKAARLYLNHLLEKFKNNITK